MGINQIQQEPKKPKNYTTVRFYDKEHNKSVEYNLPIGAKINTTNQEYKVKKDGLYKDNKKIKQLEVPLFDMVALSVFDANKDHNIDKNDVKKFDKNHSVAKEINKGLGKSEYYVKVRDVIENAGCDEHGFGAVFNNEKNPDLIKEFHITF